MEEFSCPSECEEAEGKGRHEAAGEKARYISESCATRTYI